MNRNKWFSYWDIYREVQLVFLQKYSELLLKMKIDCQKSAKHRISFKSELDFNQPLYIAACNITPNEV